LAALGEAFRVGAGQARSAVVEGHLQHLGDVEGPAAGFLLDLCLAGEPVGHDHGCRRRLAEGGEAKNGAVGCHTRRPGRGVLPDGATGRC
jgi:hypothetical protein